MSRPALFGPSSRTVGSVRLAPGFSLASAMVNAVKERFQARGVPSGPLATFYDERYKLSQDGQRLAPPSTKFRVVVDPAAPASLFHPGLPGLCINPPPHRSRIVPCTPPAGADGGNRSGGFRWPPRGRPGDGSREWPGGAVTGSIPPAPAQRNPRGSAPPSPAPGCAPPERRGAGHPAIPRGVENRTKARELLLHLGGP